MEIQVEKLCIAVILALLVAVVAAPFVVMFAKKMNASQTILEYVKEHSGKQGTPTMGGIIFLISLLIVSLLMLGSDSTLAFMSLASALAFGIIGFLDDFIKVRFKQNQGLRAYQKIIGQVGVALILAYFVYRFVGTEIYLPFTLQKIDFGFWIIPFVIFVYIAMVNSVNLIDGLDGLCSGVSIFYILGVVLFLSLFSQKMGFSGLGLGEVENLILVCCIMLGALMGFLLVNCFPAKIFMGDTGSLAIGGFLASILIFCQNPFMIAVFGMMFVVTAVSDIIQVGVFKIKRKRVFKMAPLHHHFQMCGMHENRIVAIYIIVTVGASLLGIYLTAVF